MTLSHRPAPTTCHGPIGRRDFLRLGVAGLAGKGLAISDLLRLRARAAAGTGERTALLVVYTHGGASHLDTFDPKPDAPAEFRGPFRPISTRVAGLQVCEALPQDSGGGLRTGQVIGRTDGRGEQVIDRRVTPHDFLATVYHHLEVPAKQLQFTDTSGRPVPVLPDGKPIPELCAG